MSYDYTETNSARNDSLNMEKSRIDREHVLRREELFLKDFGNRRGRWIKQLITIDVSDRVPIDESTSSLDDRPIVDRWSRFDFIA